MLKLRVITACVLLACLFSALFLLPYRGFVLAVLWVFSLAAWEWSNLAGVVIRWQRAVYVAIFACVLFVLSGLLVTDSRWLLPLLGLSVAGWVLALLALWHYPARIGWNGVNCLLLTGIWLLLPPALGLMMLQRMPAGAELILVLIAVIAVSDIGGYFFGRRFGRNKLAIEISPGKTWEGFWGGMCASFVFAILLGFFGGLEAVKFIKLCAVLVSTAAISVLGDLFESMIKRARGVKDSGQLLPGHGGVLDRIDGWTAAVPFFVLCYLVMGRLI